MLRLTLLLALFSAVAMAAKENLNVKYKEGKRIDFEALLIEGENKQPDVSVVTGDLGEKDLGLLKLRESFADSIQDDSGEEIQ